MSGSVALFSRYYRRSVPFVDVARAISSLDDMQGRWVTDSERGREGSTVIAQKQRAHNEQDSKSPRNRVRSVEAVELPIGQLRMIRNLAASSMDDELKLDHAFLFLFGRHPSPAERQPAIELLKRDDGKEIESLEFLFWALANTAEFAQHH